jgi:hypothetical protein
MNRSPPGSESNIHLKNSDLSGSYSLPRKLSEQIFAKKFPPPSKRSPYFGNPKSKSLCQKIYASKAISFISKIPLVYSSEIILQALWRFFVNGASISEIENVVFHSLTVLFLF